MMTAQPLHSAVQAATGWVATLTRDRVAAAASTFTLGSRVEGLGVEVEFDPYGQFPAAPASITRCATTRPSNDGCITRGHSGVLFDGVLYNRPELTAALSLPASSVPDAMLILRAYERWGVELTRHVKGIFAIVIWDGEKRQLLAVRDPLGAYPLFYAEGRAGRLLMATSMEALTRHPDVDGEVNRAALADHLCHRWPYPGETFFATIKRVPSGNYLLATSAGVQVHRYWDPAPLGEPVDWVTEDELETFDQRLDTAVQRALDRGRSGIFLSGGLDSISVAAVATDLSRRAGKPAPIALSLGFPHPDCNEELVQRGVASKLEIEQEFVPFGDAAPVQGLLTAALEHTRASSTPMLNTWSPAYTELARRGKRRGIEVILSGAGGDEWLTVSPCLAADLMRSGEMREFARLISFWQRSYHLSAWRLLRGNCWTYGARPLAGLALSRMAPKAWHANRLARLRRTTPAWVAPNAQLRGEIDRRTEDALSPSDPVGGFYFQDVRASLDHTLTSMELEEIFEMGRRLDVKFMHPYWDADVVDMLYRTPPRLLFRNGRAKSLVRDTVARRFPALGLDRQKKVAGTTFFRSVLAAEVPKLWKRSGGAPTLAAMGIIDSVKVNAMVETCLAQASRDGLGRVWDLLNLEAWVHARTSGS